VDFICLPILVILFNRKYSGHRCSHSEIRFSFFQTAVFENQYLSFVKNFPFTKLRRIGSGCRRLVACSPFLRISGSQQNSDSQVSRYCRHAPYGNAIQSNFIREQRTIWNDFSMQWFFLFVALFFLVTGFHQPNSRFHRICVRVARSWVWWNCKNAWKRRKGFTTSMYGNWISDWVVIFTQSRFSHCHVTRHPRYGNWANP